MKEKQTKTEKPVPEPFGAVKNVRMNVANKILEM